MQAHFPYSPTQFPTVIGHIEALRRGISVSCLFRFAVARSESNSSRNLTRSRIESYPQLCHAFSLSPLSSWFSSVSCFPHCSPFVFRARYHSMALLRLNLIVLLILLESRIISASSKTSRSFLRDMPGAEHDLALQKWPAPIKLEAKVPLFPDNGVAFIRKFNEAYISVQHTKPYRRHLSIGKSMEALLSKQVQVRGPMETLPSAGALAMVTFRVPARRYHYKGLLSAILIPGYLLRRSCLILPNSLQLNPIPGMKNYTRTSMHLETAALSVLCMLKLFVYCTGRSTARRQGHKLSQTS